MAAVHFSAIPCERYTARKVQGKKAIFCNICLCAYGIVYVGFEDVLHFL